LSVFDLHRKSMDEKEYIQVKVPAGWNKLIEAYREKHREALELRGVSSNSAAVLYILSRVMVAEGLLEELDVVV